ncbi:hypothetical protein S40288_09455, partial [Stachybotrys chartarum IBT 40288]
RLVRWLAFTSPYNNNPLVYLGWPTQHTRAPSLVLTGPRPSSITAIMMKKSWRTTTGSTAGNGSPPRTSMARSQTGSQSIRGRISSPIPIPNPMDDQHPVPDPPSVHIAPALASEVNDTPSELPRRDKSASPMMPSPGPRSTLISNRSPEPEALLSSSVPSGMAHESASPVLRTSPPNAVRYSTMSVSAGTEQSGNSKDQPQRKKSSLRGALGRLFGRKKSTPSPESNPRASRKPPPNLAMQEPLVEEPTSPKPDQKRSASLPVSQYDRALRSHSIGPDDVMAIESARNSLTVDLSFSNRRHRGPAGLPAHARRMTEGEWTGLSPRPFSGHGRGMSLSHNVSDPENIGRAFTCDTATKRRRSRSLSGLPGVEEDHNDVRRRSDEIRYWRESYNPNLGDLRPSTAAEGDVGAAVPAESAAEQPPPTPLQPFSFGNMTELAGMKITQAASMETRIGSLESRMRRMEKVVTQLANVSPNFNPQSDQSDQGNHSMPKGDAHLSVFAGSNLDHRGFTRPSTQQSELSKTSFGDAPTYVASIQPSSGGHVPFHATHRPISTTTIRAAASLPTLSRDFNGPFTMDHFTALTALLETERAARQALEAQVKSLGHQITIMNKQYRRGESSAMNGFSPTAQSFGEHSAFDEDDDDHDMDEEPRKHRGVKPKQLVLEDSGIATGDTEEEDAEDFITPHEEMQRYGPFDEDGLDYSEAARRKTARTMSLSQMTLTKSPTRQTHEIPPPMI